MMLHYRAFSVATHPGLVEAIKKSMLVLAKTVSIKMTFLGKPCIAFFFNWDTCVCKLLSDLAQCQSWVHNDVIAEGNKFASGKHFAKSSILLPVTDELKSSSIGALFRNQGCLPSI